MKATFKHPRKVGGKLYGKGQHDLPEAAVKDWYLQALVKEGVVSLPEAKAKADAEKQKAEAKAKADAEKQEESEDSEEDSKEESERSEPAQPRKGRR